MQTDTDYYDELGISFRTRGRRKRKRRARLAAQAAPVAVEPVAPYIEPVIPYTPVPMPPAPVATQFPNSALTYAPPYSVPGMALQQEYDAFGVEAPGVALPAYIATGYAAGQGAPGEPAATPNWLIPAALAALVLFGGF